MTKAKTKVTAESIRDEIAKIPAPELRYAKPARVLSRLEEAGMKITPSARSATSKLLARAKNMQEKGKMSEVMTFDTSVLSAQESTGRRELAMRLIESCGGDFELARTEIARLEQFVQMIKEA